MRTTARQTRENRTITVDFQNEATYFHLLGDGKAFVELVLAFVMSLGFQLKHKTTCCGGGCLTRHSHYVRVRLGGVTIWRLQCTTCRAVFTILPHFILRYRQDAPRGGPRCPAGHPRRPESGVVCDPLSYLPDGPLSSDLCAWAAESGHRADPVWAALTHLFSGR
jgi:hypothetical protein